MPFIHVDEAIELMKMEYAEMPELKLTFCQARRLWNLSDEMCERALTALTGSGFLRRARDGSYVRSIGSPRRVVEATASPDHPYSSSRRLSNLR